MPITMGGIASGIDTEGIIKKLVAIEARPIRKIEKEKREYNFKKHALKELSKVLDKLDKSAKELYGHRASYDDKKALSSNESILNAVANKKAAIGRRKLEILQLASNHRIISDPIDKNKKIPAGKFRININGKDILIKFRGGTLKKLHEKINQAAEKFINVFSVNTEGDKYILSLESKVEGKKGELKITGDLNLLKNVGIIKGKKDVDKNIINLIFDNKYFNSYLGDKKNIKQNGSLKVGAKGRSVNIKGILWQEYILPKEMILKKNTVLEFEAKYKAPEPEKKQDDLLPFRVEIGPEITTVIKGIKLKSYNISRERDLDKIKPKKDITDKLGIGVVINKNGKRIEKIYKLNKDAKGKQEIPIGNEFKNQKISKVIFYCNEGEAKFLNTKIATPIKDKGGLLPKNEISKAQDAKFKVDGVEIIRDKNLGINDVIKGVSLDLKNAAPKSPVTLKIEHDLEKVIKKLNDFVTNYNNYIDFTNKLTKASITAKTGDFKSRKKESGIFVGDMTLLRLKNSLATAVGNAYPSQSEDPIKILAQFGISTGKPNSRWSDIKKGKLVVDEELVTVNISKNPQGVKDLFGSDNDGDNRIDNGVGYTLNYILRSYVKPGKRNIISSEINRQDESIRMSNKQIEKLELHIKNYEQKLKRKFAKMERVMSGAKAQQNWMRQQQKAGADDR